jgi:hypothetical protein
MRIKDGWTPEGKRFFTKWILAPLLNGEMPGSIVERMGELSNATPETREMAVAEFRNTARRLCDQWIDSGKCDGVEDPWRRNINWKTEERIPLVETLRDYARRNPPRAEPGEDGRFDIWMLPTFPSDPILRARDMGVYHLIHLLDSPIRERLSRCEECSAYFTRARMPKKDMPVYHGTFCQKCKNKGAERRTVKSREQRTKRRIELAADAWNKWRPRARYGKREEWVAQQVNERQPVGWDCIKRNWVKWHMDEIVAEAERRNNAKA